MKRLAVAAFAALGLLSLPAMAGEESGFYVGAGIGEANLSIDGFEVDVGQTYKFDASDTAYKIFGGWRINKYFAMELDYFDLGNFSDKQTFDDGEGGTFTATTDIDVSGWAPYLIGTWPIGPVELSAKLGYAWYDADFKGKIDGVSIGSDSQSDDDMTWGLGIGMTFFEHFNAKLEYEVVEVSDADLDAFWLTGAWRF